VALGVAAAEIRSYIHGNTPGDFSTTMYVDSQTGQAFPHKNVIGEGMPILSPYTGTTTGYPAVPCYWTASGEIRKEPYWLVPMRHWAGPALHSARIVEGG